MRRRYLEENKRDVEEKRSEETIEAEENERRSEQT